MYSLDKDNTNNEEIDLKDVILKTNEWVKYLKSKWIIIIFVSLLGGLIGLAYAYLKKPIYKADLSFALQEEKSGGGGLSSALGLASQFGLDLGGGGAGSEFSGDNLLELMKSRAIIEKVLLTTVSSKGKNITLAENYMNLNNLGSGKEQTQKVHFYPGANRQAFTLTQDSLLGVFHQDLVKNNLTVGKVDKKLSIINVMVKSTDQLFSKNFAEVLTSVVSDFYIQTKTKKSAKNVIILQHQVDSVRAALNSALSGVAYSLDAAPNANPSKQALRVPSQRRGVDVTANTAILSELVKNLELSKMSLLQQTPLIQIIDKPILPLEIEKTGKIKGFTLGFFIAGLMTIIFLSIKKMVNESLA